MKQYAFQLRAAFLFLSICCLQLVLTAQDSTTSTTTTSTKISITEEGAEWYTSPWVWVIGAAIFILLLVALLRGGGDRTVDRRDTVVHKETIRKDNDI
jgi:hypothetical protein